MNFETPWLKINDIAIFDIKKGVYQNGNAFSESYDFVQIKIITSFRSIDGTWWYGGGIDGCVSVHFPETAVMAIFDENLHDFVKTKRFHNEKA